jgi:CoA:oxalate CoA-transferase
MTSERKGPLAGIRILEVGHMLAGPYCGMLLADLGAEVIKVEMPVGGDIARQIGPHRVGEHNVYFASLNRGKLSVTIDLSSPKGQEEFHGLVTTAHGLLTNLRPSAIKKYGLDYEGLRSSNPKIACLALTGFGLHGPEADRPAYDYVVQAMVGVMSLTGEPDGPPGKAGYSVVDNSSGIMGALGLVAKIHEGKGGQVEVSLYDTMLSQMNYLAAAYLNAGEKPERRSGGAHPYIVPAQVFPTADGHITIFVTHDRFWAKFADAAGRLEWTEDPRFATMQARSENRDSVVAAVTDVLASRTTAAWLDILVPLGIVAAGVETMESALASSLASGNQMVAAIQTSSGPIRVIGRAIRTDNDASLTPPPLLGEHDEKLLKRQGAAGGY